MCTIIQGEIEMSIDLRKKFIKNLRKFSLTFLNFSDIIMGWRGGMGTFVAFAKTWG